MSIDLLLSSSATPVYTHRQIHHAEKIRNLNIEIIGSILKWLLPVIYFWGCASSPI
jgi:hypothetical protein